MVNILTNENKTYNLNHIPEIEEDVRYCVLDCSNKDDIDYYFLPLVFLETFYAPSVVMSIGPYRIQMPLDWSVLACDDSYADLEVIPLTSLNDRGFHSIVFNPLRHMVPTPYEIDITNVYADVKWFFPKLKNGNVLVVPLEGGEKPNCALFVKEGNKIPDQISMSELFK